MPADFVTVDSGTGVVHQAPAFGEVDYDVLIAEQARFAPGDGPQLICAVGPDGRFTAEAPDYQGRWVKEADKDLARARCGTVACSIIRSNTCTSIHFVGGPKKIR